MPRINDDLLAASVPLPAGAVTPATLGLPEGGIEEAYYAALAQQPHASKSEAAADNASGGAAAPARVTPPPPGSSRLTTPRPPPSARPRRTSPVAAWPRRCASSAARRSRGELPGGWQRWADAALAAPTVPWRRVLASAVRRAIAHAAGCHDYAYSPSWAAPHPAHRHARIAPAAAHRGRRDRHLGQHGPARSWTPRWQRSKASSERPASAASALRFWPATRRWVRTLGCAASRTSSSSAAAAPTCASASPPPKPALPRPDVVVVLTDGYTPWPDRPTRARLVVAIIGDQAAAEHVPAWATTVLVPAA